MYLVICRFVDLKDSKHTYNVGDNYPWDGKPVSDERIAELCGSENKLGKPLIKGTQVIEKPKVKRSKKKTDA